MTYCCSPFNPDQRMPPAAADPFADAAEGDDSGKDYVHIRVQQRNGKKSLTTIQVGHTLLR